MDIQIENYTSDKSTKYASTISNAKYAWTILNNLNYMQI